MIESIITGLCVAVPSILATILSNRKSNALLTYRIDQLELEQKKHNNLIDRMYKVESRVTILEDEMRGVKENEIK
jgi:hypothetical protein